MTDSKKIEDGGCAHPLVFMVSAGSNAPDGSTSQINQQFVHTGMSLRDWFAGQAINGICAGLCADASNGYAPSAFNRVGITEAAKDAYLIADAMLIARKGGEA